MRTIPRILLPLLAGALLTGQLRAQISIIGDLSHDRQARPGETYEGTILLKNNSSEPAEAKIYQTDYLFFRDGKNIYGEPGSAERSNSGWITYNPDRVIIPARSMLTIEYRVTIPLNSGTTQLNGSYWSMLMVEGIGKGSPESSLGEPDQKTLGVSQVFRYGVQIATHIAGTGDRAIKFLDTKLVKEETGEHYLVVDIENSGDLWMRPDVYVEVFDTDGKSRGKQPGSSFRMYPGTSVRQRIEMPDLPSGEYKALVVVDAGGADAFGAQYTLRF
jgi:archaellum component FlaG (FlaF/FlaG flagellin family)